MANNYDIKSLLEIIFNVTKKNAKILAHQYLLKDVSIISKWRSNVALPRNYDISKIVEFVDDESTASQKRIIRDDIEKLLMNSNINNNLKDIVISMNDFNDFLREAISVSISNAEQSQYGIEVCSDNNETDNNSVKQISDKSENRYTGVVELDLFLPEDGNLDNLSGAGIEFKGKVNITPKKKVVKVANYLRSRSVFGVVLVWIFTGTLIALFTGLQNTNFFVFGSKDAIVQTTPTPFPSIKKPQASLQAIVPASAVISPTAVPVHKPTPSKKPTDKELAVSKTVNNNKTNVKTNNNTKSKTKNETTIKYSNNNISLNGQDQALVFGENNAVSIEKD
ncbi:hypothetical protein [Pseudobacteroides cellulosolvens]|uniref:Uncharacterized protein n=1 Tax=Pseudobacteroides cellulosolvens ATCC 35603 = DSM 2933 TaxID=398512 RepID=A0A0L6JV90_9FIRM|nr:hypothetical protein [Pseudobacteroides cellulosolvens]KNY29728.1 hypothetical protein Bccel_5005 [Pseudobacteroides cellulosolvens ATCC 35603 = DSM 2933]